ncbi:MAG: 2-hydroxychromene-2-carboxylate isomerase [Burkholderiales bacterium]|nr:2-hydroxychromene-2-carboxylate isomerase [Burkholderiales bacterium]
MKHIDFFFDFISPFAYLANIKLPEIARKYGATINYKPIDVVHAKLAAGNYGPSTRDIPAKARYIRQDRLRWAALYNVPMVVALNGARAPRLNSGVFYAGRKNQVQQYVALAYHQVWGVGIDPEDDAAMADLAGELGWDAKEYLAYVNSPQARDEYAKSQREAHSRGVFGAPIMIVDEQIFWGNDRLDFLEKYLAETAA